MSSPTTVAIVTGASRGLGQALALGLLNHDTHVITISRTHDAGLARHAQDSGYTLEQIQADLANPAAAERVAQDVVANLPTTAQRYILINNAGRVEPIGMADDLNLAAEVTAAFSLNVTSAILLTATFLKAVKPLQADVRIMNISSGAGRNPMPGWGVYCATKAALDHYSVVVNAEQHGVRITSIAPGVIDTSMQQTIRGQAPTAFPAVDRFQEMHRSGQLAAAPEIAARLLRFLHSPDYGRTVIDDIRHHA
ncbi:MAG: SDR family NAD(P)-dependent oxidoreductase [Burkholderiaceae bacterium]|jgi:benzil reductase ((S)-benzoin forming)